jgi:hypothetical protein
MWTRPKRGGSGGNSGGPVAGAARWRGRDKRRIGADPGGTEPGTGDPGGATGRERAYCATPVSVPWNFDAGGGVRAPNLISITAFL